MKRFLLLAALVLVMLLTYVAAGPYRAVADIKRGIAAKDAELLQEHIDFVALRQNLKSQLRGRLGALPDQRQEGAAALASGFGGWLVDGMVETLVTPAGLAALVAGRDYLTVNDRHSGKNGDPLLEDARYGYDSLNRFSVWIPDAEKREETRLVLERRGWHWQLVDIQLAAEH